MKPGLGLGVRDRVGVGVRVDRMRLAFSMVLARQLCMRGGDPSRGRSSAAPGGTSPTNSKPRPVRVPASGRAGGEGS